MYTELNLWEAAQQLVESCDENPNEILRKKAQTQAESKDVISAAKTFEEVGEFGKAIELLGDAGHLDILFELSSRRLTSNDQVHLKKCIEYYKKHGQLQYAIDTVKKMGDMGSLLTIYVDLQHWEEAFKISDTHPEFREQLFLPYGNWLALNDRFQEAQEYYTKANRPDESIRILKFLVENSVYQHRYKLAGYYYWRLSNESLTLFSKKAAISQRMGRSNNQSDWRMYRKLAEVYYSYSQVYKFVEDPFTLSPPESLLNSAKFVLVYLLNNPCPPQISKSYTLYCLAKIASKLKCHKTARFAFEKLLQTKLPFNWQDSVELAALLNRAKPNTDPEEYCTVCFQCSYVHPFMNTRENSCPNCLEPYVQSFYSFGNLPLIRFSPDPKIPEEEVTKLIKEDPPIDSGKFSHSQEEIMKLAELERTGKGIYSPVVFEKERLRECHPQKVFTRRWPSRDIPNEYYLLVSDDVHVVMCESCQQFFEEGEWNYQVLLLQHCPFCKQPSAVRS
jgi:intraflagellar transport protein 122